MAKEWYQVKLDYMMLIAGFLICFMMSSFCYGFAIDQRNVKIKNLCSEMSKINSQNTVAKNICS